MALPYEISYIVVNFYPLHMIWLELGMALIVLIYLLSFKIMAIVDSSYRFYPSNIRRVLRYSKSMPYSINPSGSC